MGTLMQHRSRLRWAGLAVMTIVGIGAMGSDRFANYPWIDYDHPAIAYSKRTPADPVGLLEQKLKAGEITLRYDRRWGYLPDVLRRLEINTDSQMLVFSKTSFQAARISPAKPRALYFRDDVFIGSVQDGEVLEAISLDPEEGVQFYTLDVHESAHPNFVRRDIACLQCHSSPATLNVPGLLVTSSYTGTDGIPAFRGAQDITDHRTPLAERWGGWYVTGTAGRLEHRGNAVAPDPSRPTELDTTDSQNLTSLKHKINPTSYLEPTSDMVALMTLEHQTRMTNLMTRFSWETRIAIAEGKGDDFQKRLDADADELVAYMLFADEAKIDDPIAGVSTFTKTFPLRGPRDHLGRSLRDFDLSRRLFRYPLSYMIYADSFDRMPGLLKDRIYRKLYDVLTGKDSSGAYARLTTEDRRNIMEILLETKPTVPAFWRHNGG